jgi:hypothetical protein
MNTVQPYGTNAVPATLTQTVEVTVVNFNMPFLALVGFLVKFSLAAIPASLILMLVWGLLFALLGGGLGLFGLLSAMLSQVR